MHIMVGSVFDVMYLYVVQWRVFENSGIFDLIFMWSMGYIWAYTDRSEISSTNISVDLAYELFDGLVTWFRRWRMRTNASCWEHTNIASSVFRYNECLCLLVGGGIAQCRSAGLRMDDRVRVPAEAGNFSLHHRVETQGREADQSPPFDAEIKNAWSYTSTLSIRLHGVVLSLKENTWTTLHVSCLLVYKIVTLTTFPCCRYCLVRNQNPIWFLSWY
jgi:hypothetical protein